MNQQTTFRALASGSPRNQAPGYPTSPRAAMVESPFGSAPIAESTSVRAMEARESTEVMAMAVMAKRFPRDPVKACDQIRNAFTRVSLAERAQYQFARGGTDISGPSIRAAEAIGQLWGNLSTGWSELSRTVGPDGVGMSEVEAYCIDYQSTNRETIKFWVRHWRDTKRGGYAIRDERDIYELCANQAQRRKRACILAQVPGDVTEMAMQQVAVTLAAKADTSPEAIKRMVEAFAPYGVTAKHIEQRLQRRLDAIQPAQVVALRRIYTSLQDEMSTPGDWFDMEPAPDQPEPPPAPEPPAPATTTRAPRPRRPTPPAGAEPPPSDDQPDLAGMPGRNSYADYANAIVTASDSETAALTLDEARGVLDPEQLDDLAGVYRRKWSGDAAA